MTVLLSLACVGCSYTCHGYRYVQPTVEDDRWQVWGEIVRSRPKDWIPGPGSWPHWSADPNDRYTLKLAPATTGSEYWSLGRVDIINVGVFSPTDTVQVQRAEILGRVYVSEPFCISTPVPDSLTIEFDLALVDALSNQVRRVIHVRTTAVAERHRRWHLADMAES